MLNDHFQFWNIETLEQVKPYDICNICGDVYKDCCHMKMVHVSKVLEWLHNECLQRGISMYLTCKDNNGMVQNIVVGIDGQ